MTGIRPLWRETEYGVSLHGRAAPRRGQFSPDCGPKKVRAGLPSGPDNPF